MRAWVCSFTLFAAAGCGSPARESISSPTAAKADGAPLQQIALVVSPTKAVAATEPWGTAIGRIIGVGDFPAREVVKVPATHNDFNFCMKNGEFLDEEWVVDPKTKGLKNTFVWLAPAEKDGKLAIHPARQKIADSDKKVVIDQPLCMFAPRALALREGQVLIVKNTAKAPHNFKWGGNPEVNPGGNPTIVPGEQVEVNVKADRSLVLAECGLHPWMKATIMAFDHPYFAVTDEQGRFEIKDAPAGPCRLVIRHSTGIWLDGVKGKNGRLITIQSGDNDLGALEYPAPPK